MPAFARMTDNNFVLVLVIVVVVVVVALHPQATQY
jgi:hypothetical protein